MRKTNVPLCMLLLVGGLASCRNSTPAATTSGSVIPASDSAPRAATERSANAGQAAPPESKTTDWPRFRGPEGTGISKETGINKDWKNRPPKLLWKQPMSDGGYCGPSVANGAVYIVDHKGSEDTVRALDLQTGDEKWHYTFTDASESNYGFTRTTPTVDGDRVYTLSRLGKLHCFQTATGKIVWQKDIIAEFKGQRPGWDLAGSPLVDGKKLLVCAGGQNAAVVAMNKLTGEPLWMGGGSEAPGYATIVPAVIGGKKQYVCFFAKSVSGVDAESGSPLWRYPWNTSYDVNAATPLVFGNSVFITSGYGRGCALIQVQGGSAQPRWENKEMQAHFSSPIYFDGHIYGTGDPGQLMCLDPQTGKALWKQAGFEKGGITVVDGVILGFNGSNGDLIMAELTPSGYNELGRFAPLGGQSWTAPIVASGKLIVRNKEALACLDIK